MEGSVEVEKEPVVAEEEKKGEEEDEGPRTIERTLTIDFQTNEQGEEVLNGFLKFKEVIGEGAFCKVRRVVGTFEEDDGSKYDQELAIKIFKKTALKKQLVTFYDSNGLIQMKTALDQVLDSEIRVWQRFDHKNFVKIFELFSDVDKDQMYLIMQYCDIGQIATWDPSEKKFVRNEKAYARALEAGEFKYIDGDYSDLEKAAKHIFRQVAEGLHYMHEEMKAANRDIKLENILYQTEEDKVKITDFTTAMDLPTEDFEIKDRDGTKSFEAPECVTQQSFKPRPLDIWAFGVSLYSYLTCRLPFFSEVDAELEKMITESEPEYPESLSEEAKDLMRKLLEKDPAKRLTSAQILEHPWMNEPEPLELPS